MKGNFIKIVALLSSLLLVFSLVACGEKKDDTTTTSATKPNVEAVGEAEQGENISETDENGEQITDVSVTEESDETTNNDSEDKTTKNNNAAKTTTKKDKVNSNDKTTAATTKKNANQAPVDGSVAEIVAFYNKAANATKAKQNFTYTRKEQTKVIIDDISTKSGSLDLLTKIGNGIIDSVTRGGKPVTAKEVFVNGKPTMGDISLKDSMPIMDNNKMSTLTADGVKSATCKKDGDGYIVTIVLKPEKGTLKQKPPAHAACVNYLRLEVLDLGPLNDNIKSAEMNYIDDTNSGTKFVVRINKNNLLDYMNTYMSIKGGGSGTILGITATAKLHGTYDCEYKFIW